MKRSGRFSPFIVVGVICLVMLVPLLFLTRTGPEKATAEFMGALGTANVEKLAELSIIGNHSVEERRKLWQESVGLSKHYVFTWRITDVTKIDENHSAVILMVRRNLQIRMGEDETKFQVPMVKTDAGWRVAVDQLNRDLYPYLPRA
jgi:hypothetical protein